MKGHVLASKINSILHDNKFDRYVSGKSRGDLDFNSLSKISYSSKVFKKREARQNKDYKLIVLADASGSMHSDNKIGNTMEALNTINTALAKTDVEYAIWSFAADVLVLKDFSEKETKNVGELYYTHSTDRYIVECESCHVCTFGFLGEEHGGYPYSSSGFDRRATAACESCGQNFVYEDYEYIGYDKSWSASYNADGLALHLAMEAIGKMSGKHIIVVLSDGQADVVPYAGTYLQKDGLKYNKMKVHDVARKAIEKGAILCSIGIQDSNVLNHYPKENTIVVKNSAGVGSALVKLISKQIKRG